MPDVFIDPAIVITPDDNVGKDGVVEWITNFTIWLHEALSSPFVWLHSIEATALLEAHGRFPSFETLRHLQRKYGLDINPAQIVKKVNEFFRDEERDLGGKLKMLAFDVEVENGSVVIQPSTLLPAGRSSY